MAYDQYYGQIFEDIPLWDNGTWTVTDFSSREEFAKFVRNIFKEPGKYKFDETSLLFNSESRNFRENVYCTANLPLNLKTSSITGMNKSLDVEEELSTSQEKELGTLQEITTCGLISYQYLIKNNKFLTLLKSGTPNITWPSMNYWQSSTLSM
jgi:hypothetical protein